MQKASTPKTEDGDQQPNNATTTLLKQKKMIRLSDDEKEEAMRCSCSECKSAIYNALSGRHKY